MSKWIFQILALVRCRWTFQGKDEAGNVIWPEGFVKLRNRPPINLYPEDDEIKWGGGYVTIEQFFTFYEEPEVAKKEFDKLYSVSYKVRTGVLRLYDVWSCT